jgi:hypothetical protein
MHRPASIHQDELQQMTILDDLSVRPARDVNFTELVDASLVAIEEQIAKMSFSAEDLGCS